MQVWIDNTGLHGAGRCLLGQARTKYDIQSFLQFATLLVFSDKLELGGFESEAIASASRTFRDEFVSAGLASRALSIRATTEAEFQLACTVAAKFAASDMPFGYRQGGRTAVGLAVIDLPRGGEHRGRELTQLATGDGHLDLDTIARDALTKKAAGAVHYMLAISPELRGRAAKTIAHAKTWDEGDSFELEGYLRAVLNTELARLARATYAPAPSRGELIDRENLLAIEILQTQLAGIVRQLRPPTMQLPPVASALLWRSQGDPKGLVQEALWMREQAKPLRAYLAEAAKAAAGGSMDGREALYREIAKLGRHLRQVLRLDGNTSLLGALDVDVALGLPSDMGVGTSLGAVKQVGKWIQHLRMRPKLVVLTEIVRTAAFASTSRKQLHRLAEAATGRSLEPDDPVLDVYRGA